MTKGHFYLCINAKPAQTDFIHFQQQLTAILSPVVAIPLNSSLSLRTLLDLCETVVSHIAKLSGQLKVAQQALNQQQDHLQSVLLKERNYLETEHQASIDCLKQSHVVECESLKNGTTTNRFIF